MDASENILFLQIFLTPCFPTYPNVLILIYIPTFCSSLTITPCFIVITRSFISFTISWLCVTTSTVVPLSFASFKRLMISHEFVGSKFPVGSSANKIAGSFTIALAIATRCCSPPDNSFGKRFIFLRKTDQRKRRRHFFLITLSAFPSRAGQTQYFHKCFCLSKDGSPETQRPILFCISRYCGVSYDSGSARLL